MTRSAREEGREPCRRPEVPGAQQPPHMLVSRLASRAGPPLAGSPDDTERFRQLYNLLLVGSGGQGFYYGFLSDPNTLPGVRRQPAARPGRSSSERLQRG